MAEFTKELILRTLDEWGRYAEVFRKQPANEQANFLNAQGYASMRDLLAHVAAWWEEGRGIIRDRIEHGERPLREYDFNEFNAAALNRFRDTPEAQLLSWYEAERQRMIELVSRLTDEQMKMPRIRSWLDGVVLEHLKEHGVDAPRFLIIDILQREWGGYGADFAALEPEKQASFLERQGFSRFRDLLAHILAWWEQGIAVVEGSSSNGTTEVEDVDAFNAEAVERFDRLEEAQVVGQFEETRLTLANLVDMLPDDVLAKHNVQSWLKADVIDHYHNHAV